MFSSQTTQATASKPKTVKVGGGKFRTLADLRAEEEEQVKQMIDHQFTTLTNILEGPPTQPKKGKGKGPSKEFEEHYLKIMDP